MLLLQVASLVVGISLLAPVHVEARLTGDNAAFLGASKCVTYGYAGR